MGFGRVMVCLDINGCDFILASMVCQHRKWRYFYAVLCTAVLLYGTLIVVLW